MRLTRREKKGREGKEREGKGREGRGREGKGELTPIVGRPDGYRRKKKLGGEEAQGGGKAEGERIEGAYA